MTRQTERRTVALRLPVALFIAFAVSACHLSIESWGPKVAACGEDEVPVSSKRTLVAASAPAPYLYSNSEGFEIRVDESASLRLLVQRENVLSERGVSARSVDAVRRSLVEAFRHGEPVSLESLPPSRLDVDKANASFQASKGAPGAPAYEDSELYELLLRGVELSLLISHALSEGMAEVRDPQGNALTEYIAELFSGSTSQGWEVSGIRFSTPTGLTILEYCTFAPPSSL